MTNNKSGTPNEESTRANTGLRRRAEQDVPAHRGKENALRAVLIQAGD